jgi:hypothetical protein
MQLRSLIIAISLSMNALSRQASSRIIYVSLLIIAADIDA